MVRIQAAEKPRTYPPQLFVGPVLAVFFWAASWLHLGVLGEYAFFPQWLGYILTVDALVYMRRGTSLLSRAPREFIALFFLSAPIWWIFEGLNNSVLNWHYLTATQYSVAQIILLSSIDFSTVIPAIFETTELISTLAFIERFRRWRPVNISPRGAWVLMYVGAFAFAAVVLLPGIAFPLTWVWLVLLVDPLNWLRGRPSLIGRISQGDLRLVVALALAGVTCGLFWEMWNYFAMPKWYYTVPFVGFAKVFEMPILGYGGYIPFAWELHALYQLAWGGLHRPAIALELDTRVY
jgi:hypothetical protein